MTEIKIDNEFKMLLPVLDKETFALLEENILLNGCRDPIVLWGNTIIDGHNRYQICMEHDIPFNTVEKEFDSRDDVLIWIVSTQIARRNLTPIQLSFFRGLHYIADKRIQGTNNQYVQKRENRQNVGFQGSTAKRLSEQYRVVPRTIERDAKIAEAINAIGEASPEAKRKILSGEMSINKNHLQKLQAGSNEDIKQTAEKIEDGTFDKKKAAKTETAAAIEETGAGDPDRAASHPLETAISIIADEFYSYIRAFAGDGGEETVKMALRAFIDTLEEMYSQLRIYDPAAVI